MAFWGRQTVKSLHLSHTLIKLVWLTQLSTSVQSLGLLPKKGASRPYTKVSPSTSPFLYCLLTRSRMCLLPHNSPAASLFFLASARSLRYVSPHSGMTPYKPTSGERRALRVLPTSPLSTASLMAKIPKATVSGRIISVAVSEDVYIHMTSPNHSYQPPIPHPPDQRLVALTLHPNINKTADTWVHTLLSFLGVFVGLPDSTLNFIQP